MSLIQVVNEPYFKTFERPTLIVTANQAITTPIQLLEVRWDDNVIPTYKNASDVSLETIVYALRWRHNNSSWTVVDIANPSFATPALPSFLGLTTQKGFSISSGLYVDKWYVGGTPNVTGLIEVQFSINPPNTSNPFA